MNSMLALTEHHHFRAPQSAIAQRRSQHNATAVQLRARLTGGSCIQPGSAGSTHSLLPATKRVYPRTPLFSDVLIAFQQPSEVIVAIFTQPKMLYLQQDCILRLESSAD